MTQPSIDGTGHGVPRMVFGSDGADHYEIAVDSDGHVQVDVKTTTPPVPAAPVCDYGSISCATATWTDVTTYTVPAGKKLYIHYWSLGPVAAAQIAGFNYMGRLTINDTVYDFLQNALKVSAHINLSAPIVATANQVVAVEGYHAEGAARWMSATIVGFEV